MKNYQIFPGLIVSNTTSTGCSLVLYMIVNVIFTQNKPFCNVNSAFKAFNKK